MALFRAGHDDAFRVIHDRYRQRLFAYTRQMLCSRQDAEDALQDIFVRAFAGLRANDRQLALRAWLYRVAHNRCIDELRRPAPPPPEVLELVRTPAHDPIAAAEQRESLRRLIADVRRLPDQQRSALLMRELGGMTYADVAAALGVSVPAVKSLLVRARVGLAQAAAARDAACSEIREELIVAHDRGVRPSGMARRHLRECPGCQDFRREVRGVSRRLAALAPTMGPLGLLAKLGLGGGAGGGAAAGSGVAVAGGGVAAVGSSVGSGGATAGILATGAGHVATLLAAAVLTAGGAVELQRTISPAPAHHRARHHGKAVARHHPVSAAAARPAQNVVARSDARAAPAQSAPQSAPLEAAVVVPHRSAVAHSPSSAVTTHKLPVSGGASTAPARAATNTQSDAANTCAASAGTSTQGGGVGSTGAVATGGASAGAGSTTSRATGTASTGAGAASAPPGASTPAASAQSGASSTASGAAGSDAPATESVAPGDAASAGGQAETVVASCNTAAANSPEAGAGSTNSTVPSTTTSSTATRSTSPSEPSASATTPSASVATTPASSDSSPTSTVAASPGPTRVSYGGVTSGARWPSQSLG